MTVKSKDVAPRFPPLGTGAVHPNCISEVFVAWLDALKDKRAQIRIAARLRQAEAGSHGEWQPIEEGVSEMRIHDGPGYRLYFAR